jgi:hypothetical protein
MMELERVRHISSTAFIRLEVFKEVLGYIDRAHFGKKGV